MNPQDIALLLDALNALQVRTEEHMAEGYRQNRGDSFMAAQATVFAQIQVIRENLIDMLPTVEEPSYE